MKRLILARLSNAYPIDAMHCYQPDIWWARLTLTASQKEGSFWVDNFGGNFDDISEVPIEIGSITGITRHFNKVDSIADLYLQDKSFYWDDAEQTIYIRFTDPWFIYKPVTGGEIRTFVNKLQYDSSGFATTYTENLEPTLIEDSVSISQSIDPQEYGIFRYDDISLEVDNSDGRYDDMNDTSAGQVLEILFAASEDEITESDFTVARSGYVERFEFSDNKLAISGRDKRGKWTQKINTETFNSADYPNLDDRNYGKRIPLCVGTCYNVPCIRKNTSTTEFLFSTTAYGNMVSVDQVYVDGVANAHTGTETDGTFLVTGYTSGTVTADVTGVDKGNDVEKIIWLLDEFEGISEIASNYNLSEIATAKGQAKTGSLYLGTGGEKLNEVIERLLVNLGGWLIQQGYKFTIRIFDDDRLSIREIEDDELLERPSRLYDESQFVSSVTTHYKKDEKEKTFYTDYNDTREDEAVRNQYRLNNKEIETTLLNETDARAISNRYYNRFIDIPATIEMSLGTEVNNIYPTDIITYTHKRFNKEALNGEIAESEILPRSNYQVTDIDWLKRNMTLQWVKSNIEDTYILEGGDSTTDYDYYEGGGSATFPTYILDGGDS